jgi:tetratricopeptide (TPR) repeat protein
MVQGKALQKAGKFAEAIPYFEQAVDYGEGKFGDGHPKVGKILNSLGTLYRKQGRYGEAEKTLKRSFKVLENKLG